MNDDAVIDCDEVRVEAHRRLPDEYAGFALLQPWVFQMGRYMVLAGIATVAQANEFIVQAQTDADNEIRERDRERRRTASKRRARLRRLTRGDR